MYCQRIGEPGIDSQRMKNNNSKGKCSPKFHVDAFHNCNKDIKSNHKANIYYGSGSLYINRFIPQSNFFDFIH